MYQWQVWVFELLTQVAQDTNRANQLNPFHEAFWKSRKIEPGKVEMVYHGASKENADAILKKLR